MNKQEKTKIMAGCIVALLAWILIAALWFIVSAGAVAVAAWCFGFVFKWRYAIFGMVILLIITLITPNNRRK